MNRFECDYLEGAADKVLQALCETNAAQTVGYGEDSFCEQARLLIARLCEMPEAGVHFFVGGTQVNLTVIAAALRPFEGVLCADTGHINVHETGAIEATGHKVLALRGRDGKLSAEQIRAAFLAHIEDGTHEHMVRPGMVYLSHPTELGTLYTREELAAIREVTLEYGLSLYIDGARLSYALAAEPKVDLPFLARHCDAFTLGGTKCGALFGEALVLTDPAAWPHFRYHIKQRGALLAKGRLLGVQFQALMENGCYMELGKKANAQAQRIKAAFLRRGVPMLCDTLANQIFPVLPNTMLTSLSGSFSFAHWAKSGRCPHCRALLRRCDHTRRERGRPRRRHRGALNPESEHRRPRADRRAGGFWYGFEVPIAAYPERSRPVSPVPCELRARNPMFGLGFTIATVPIGRTRRADKPKWIDPTYPILPYTQGAGAENIMR